MRFGSEEYWKEVYRNLDSVELPKIKTTNFDKLMCMSKEKLAEYLCSSSKFCSENCNGHIEDPNNPCGGRCDYKCYEHCLEWLNKTIEEK